MDTEIPMWSSILFFFLRKLSDVPVPVSYELLEKIAQLFNLTA